MPLLRTVGPVASHHMPCPVPGARRRPRRASSPRSSATAGRHLARKSGSTAGRGGLACEMGTRSSTGTSGHRQAGGPQGEVRSVRARSSHRLAPGAPRMHRVHAASAGTRPRRSSANPFSVFAHAYVRFCCIHPHPGEPKAVPAPNRGPFVASSRVWAQPYPPLKSVIRPSEPEPVRNWSADARSCMPLVVASRSSTRFLAWRFAPSSPPS
jgi:hypothetical protein